jgi:hypothetical protein
MKRTASTPNPLKLNALLNGSCETLLYGIQVATSTTLTPLQQHSSVHSLSGEMFGHNVIS